MTFLEGLIAQQNQGDVALGPQLHSVFQRPEFQSSPSTTRQHPEQQYGNPSSLAGTDGDGDEVGDLASKVGMLSFAAGAEPHYLGSSSTFAFSRVINSALLQAIPQKRDGTPGSRQDTRSLPAPCLLPDYESCVKLSDAYFREVHTQYPFLDEPSFRGWEAKLIPSEITDLYQCDPVSLFFLYMVCPSSLALETITTHHPF